MPIARKPIGRKPMGQGPGGITQQPSQGAPNPHPAMPMSMPMPAPVGPGLMPMGPVPPGSTPHGIVPFYPNTQLPGMAGPMQPIQPQWAPSLPGPTPIPSQAYPAPSSVVTPSSTHPSHQAPSPYPPAMFPPRASPPPPSVSGLPTMNTNMNLAMQPRPLSVVQPTMSVPSTMSPGAAPLASSAPAGTIPPGQFTSTPAPGLAPSPAQTPAPTPTVAPVLAPGFPPMPGQALMPSPVPGPGQLRRSVTAGSVASKSDDFSRRTSLATTIAPSSPLTTVAMPIGTPFAGSPVVGATICASCKQGMFIPPTAGRKAN